MSLLYKSALPQVSKYLMIYTVQNPNLRDYYPKTEYRIIGSSGPLGFSIRRLSPQKGNLLS